MAAASSTYPSKGVRAWIFDENKEDQRELHMTNPVEWVGLTPLHISSPVSLALFVQVTRETLDGLGILQWHIEPSEEPTVSTIHVISVIRLCSSLLLPVQPRTSKDSYRA